MKLNKITLIILIFLIVFILFSLNDIFQDTWNTKKNLRNHFINSVIISFLFLIILLFIRNLNYLEKKYSIITRLKKINKSFFLNDINKESNVVSNNQKKFIRILSSMLFIFFLSSFIFNCFLNFKLYPLPRGDEIKQIENTIKIKSDKLYNDKFKNYNLYWMINSLFSKKSKPKIFGTGRIVSLLAGFILLILIFVYFKKNKNTNSLIILIPIILVSFNSSFIYYSRSYLEDASFTLFFLITLLLILQYKNNVKQFFLIGFFLGITISLKLSGVILFFTFIIIILIDYKINKIKYNKLFIPAFIIGIIIPIFPILFNLVNNGTGTKDTQLFWMLYYHGPEIKSSYNLFNKEFNLTNIILNRFSILTIGDLFFGIIFSHINNFYLFLFIISIFVDNKSNRRNVLLIYYIIGILFLSITYWKGGDSSNPFTIFGPITFIYTTEVLIDYKGKYLFNIFIKIILYIILISSIINILFSLIYQYSMLQRNETKIPFFYITYSKYNFSKSENELLLFASNEFTKNDLIIQKDYCFFNIKNFQDNLEYLTFFGIIDLNYISKKYKSLINSNIIQKKIESNIYIIVDEYDYNREKNILIQNQLLLKNKFPLIFSDSQNRFYIYDITNIKN